MLTSHSTIGVGWTPPLIEHQVAATPDDEAKAPGLPVQVPPASWCMAIYQVDDTSSNPPSGFLAFTPTIHLRGDMVAALDLDIHLAWMTPKVRHKGYGRHLAANLGRYLRQHGPAVNKAGRTASPAGDCLVASEDLVVTIKMPMPDRVAVRFADYIHEFFAPGRSERWHAATVAVKPA
jgi:hypothetical protein